MTIDLIYNTNTDGIPVYRTIIFWSTESGNRVMQYYFYLESKSVSPYMDKQEDEFGMKVV